MEGSIAAVEAKIAELERQLEEGPQSTEERLRSYRLLTEAQQRREMLFTRWQELEEKASG